MAFQLDTNIPLLARSGDPAAGISQGLQVGSMIDQLRTTREQAPIRQQLLQQQQQAGALANQRQQQAIQAADQDRQITSVAQGAQEILPLIDKGDFKGAINVLEKRKERLISEDRNTDDTQEAIDAIQSGDAQSIQTIKTLAETAVNIAQTRGLLAAQGGKLSAEQRGFEDLIGNFSEDEQIKARKIRAGLEPRAGESAQERIAADEAKKDQVRKLEEQLAESKAVGKGKGEAKVAPLISKARSDIAAAVKLAATEAAARGEALTDLRKAEAGLPGIEEVVEKLNGLSSIATHTLGGKAFNFAAKELGFGSTKGGTARAAYQATIDNQVLPLLKQTFGAAMTEGEGKRLADTLGDVDAAPEAKQAQLNAFMDSQRRIIENLKRETGTGQQNSFTSSSGITFTVE